MVSRPFPHGSTEDDYHHPIASVGRQVLQERTPVRSHCPVELRPTSGEYHDKVPAPGSLLPDGIHLNLVQTFKK